MLFPDKHANLSFFKFQNSKNKVTLSKTFRIVDLSMTEKDRLEAHRHTGLVRQDAHPVGACTVNQAL